METGLIQWIESLAWTPIVAIILVTGVGLVGAARVIRVGGDKKVLLQNLNSGKEAIVDERAVETWYR